MIAAATGASRRRYVLFFPKNDKIVKEEIEFKNIIKYIIKFHNSILEHNRVLLKLNSNNLFSENELSIIQESILIKQVTAWENFVYDIITYCISLNTKKISEHIGIELPESISYDNAKAIFNGINFSSLSNSNDIMDKAENLITEENNPFQQFLPPMLRYVDEAYLLRNYIAHKSHVSKAKISKMYLNNYKINDFIIPGKFLNSKQSFDFEKGYVFEMYYFIYMQIAVFCWRFLDRNSYNQVFKKNNQNENLEIGYLNMSIVFEDLNKKINY